MNTAPKLLTDEQAEVLREMRDELASQCDGRPDADNCITCRVRREVIDAAIAIAPPSGDGVDKVFAWMKPDCSDVVLAKHRVDRWINVYTIPLYTTPQSAPVDGDFVMVPRESLERLGDGIENCIENARIRGDVYDVGYMGAMSREVETWLREQHATASPVGDDVYRLLRDIRPALACEDTFHPCTDLRRRIDKILTTPPPASQERGGDDHVRKLVGKLDQWRACMSYNESYFGEPAGLVKSTVAELARAVDPIYPPKADPVDPLAGVTIHTATVPLAASPPSSAAEECVTAGGTSTSDDELPGMWSPSDLTGGATDAAEQAKPTFPKIEDRSHEIFIADGMDGDQPVVEQAKPVDLRSWPEDYENGDYENICCHCKQTFFGHKRRVTCKLCSKPAVKQAKPDIVDAVDDPNGECPTCHQSLHVGQAQAGEPWGATELANGLSNWASIVDNETSRLLLQRSAALLRRLAGGVTDEMVLRALCSQYGVESANDISAFHPENVAMMRAALVAALGAK